MPPAKTTTLPSLCPCGSQKNLVDCCQPFISGQYSAPTAEALMRSRYSAHALLAIDYLWSTWHPKQRIYSSKSEIRQWASSCEWLALEILATQAGLENDLEGLVTFVAHYRHNGHTQQHHELSLFKKTDGAWLYISHHDGV